MIFDSAEHYEKNKEICSRMKKLDCYHRSLAYLIALDKVLREHIDDIFDFTDDCIKPEALHKDFQTSTSLKTTRLAFNLWNGYAFEGESYTDKNGSETELPSISYTPEQIFACPEYALFYWRAIHIRFTYHEEG